jgi:hypothetical protein
MEWETILKCGSSIPAPASTNCSSCEKSFQVDELNAGSDYKDEEWDDLELCIWSSARPPHLFRKWREGWKYGQSSTLRQTYQLLPIMACQRLLKMVTENKIVAESGKALRAIVNPSESRPCTRTMI